MACRFRLLLLLVVSQAVAVGCSDPAAQVPGDPSLPSGTADVTVLQPATPTTADGSSAADADAPDLASADASELDVESDGAALDTAESDTPGDIVDAVVGDTTDVSGPDGVADAAQDLVPDMAAPPTSCVDLRDTGETQTGLYDIELDGLMRSVWCDFDRNGGGWTLIAKISANGDVIDQGNWLQTGSPNHWESTSEEFGTAMPTVNEDYRSAAFGLLDATDIQITWNNQFLLTANGCLNQTSLAATMRGLAFSCQGGDPVENCSLVCPITNQSPKTGEAVLLGELQQTNLYLKSGEGDGVDAGNTDRVYIASDYRNYPHFVSGLGARCFDSCGGTPGSGDVSLNTDSVSLPPSDQFWSIWVR